MSIISSVFDRKKKNVLNIYCTAGFPELQSTVPVMQALEKYGADIIELGIPYSDPLADGPVIQASGNKALENGMSIAELFRQLKGFRNKVSIPVILMGYMNPVMQYGFEKFCSQAAAVGIDGLILPDLPIYEFENEYRAVLQKNHLDFIFLITPETGLDRIRKLDELSSGFLYLVSSSSTTGKDKNMSDQEAYFERMSSMNLRNPTLIGFGIKDKHTFQAACRYARGAIIGSAYINSLEKAEDIDIATGKFLNSILK